jgi:hypothetical protein
MKRLLLWLSVLAAVVAVLETPARASDLTSKLRVRFQNRLLGEVMSPDGRLEREPGLDRGLLRSYFHHSAASDSTRHGFLAVNYNRLYGIERYEVSPAQVVFEHAEAAASLALFASAIGTTLGAWDEESSLYFIGAAAAAGALWGGTRADEPGLRVRYRWEP